MKKGICGIALVLALMLCMISGAVSDSQNGVRIRVTSDKAYYGEHEAACLTVRVENMLDKPIYHVRIEEQLPDGLQLAEESNIFVIDEIPAHASAAQSFYVMKRLDGLSVVLKADKPKYEKGEIAELRVFVINHLDVPVQNVRIEHLLPSGLQYVDHSDAYALEHSVLKPGESIEYAVRVKVMNPLPETGDQSHVQIVFCAAVMISAIALLLRIRKNEEVE